VDAGGSVVGIFIAPDASAPVESLRSVRAVEGRGLEGDRYFSRTGTYSDREGTGREVTLVEREAVDELLAGHGIAIRPEESRRNIVTEGVALGDLIDRPFRVGPVVLVGRRLCEPCEHLASLTHPGIVKAFVHRAGLRADIVQGGTITVGDPVVPSE
jgi:MOSC domain-containing protein YiiM